MSSSPNLQSRIRGAFLGLAVCDALGGPAEFKTRGTFPKITTMKPNANFGLPPGCFTDDTSMALCLAHSFLEKGPADSTDQARKYLAWSRDGWMSSIGTCFDIGAATSHALSIWGTYLQRNSHLTADIVEHALDVINHNFNRERSCGNGSLMRVLPAALIFADPAVVARAAVYSSLTTHPHIRCIASCMLYTQLVRRALDGSSKNSLVVYLQQFIGHFDKGGGEQAAQPFIERLSSYRTVADFENKPADQISSSGYVLDSLEAALWAFFTTATFQDGAVRVVNLGDDADTVGAIFGGLAGAFYGAEQIPSSWTDTMIGMDLLEDAIRKISEKRTQDNIHDSLTNTSFTQNAAESDNARITKIMQLFSWEDASAPVP